MIIRVKFQCVGISLRYRFNSNQISMIFIHNMIKKMKKIKNKLFKLHKMKIIILLNYSHAIRMKYFQKFILN